MYDTILKTKQFVHHWFHKPTLSEETAHSTVYLFFSIDAQHAQVVIIIGMCIMPSIYIGLQAYWATVPTAALFDTPY